MNTYYAVLLTNGHDEWYVGPFTSHGAATQYVAPKGCAVVRIDAR